MLSLLVILVILSLLAWGGRAIMAGMGAPQWLHTVVLVVVLIIAVVIVAGAFSIPVPSLR